MTGAEHYRKAERLLAGSDTGPESEDDATRRVAAAQVHATLAAAAATYVASDKHDKKWSEVAL